MKNRRKGACLLTAILLLCAVSASAAAWEAPCVSAPHGWEYQDDTKAIAINKVSENGVTYFVADVQLSDVSGFQTALSEGAPVSEMAKRSGAVLAVNGDDYGTHPYGVIIRNGQLLRAHDTTRNLLALDAQGGMHVKVNRKSEKSAELGKQLIASHVWQTFEFGPELVRDGQAVAFDADFDVISTKPSRVEPRTAIGQVGALHYILIVVDGRQEGYSLGMSLADLQQLLLRYGAKTAMNLDGGGSAEMWFQGKVISSPSGGEERYVTDIICF